MIQNEFLKKILVFLSDQNTTTQEFLDGLLAEVTCKFEVLPDWDTIGKYLQAVTVDQTSVTFYNDDSGLEAITINATDSNAKLCYEKFCEDGRAEDEIKITFRIVKKNANGVISVYCFDKFCETICTHPIPTMLGKLKIEYEKSDHLYFHVLDQEMLFQTETMTFTSDMSEMPVNTMKRKQRLVQCESVSDFKSLQNYPFVPEDFHIISPKAPERLRCRFERICGILSLAYLAESCEMLDDSLDLTFNRKQPVSCTIKLDEIPKNTEFYNIYRLVYAEGNAADKVILARKAICTHLGNYGLEKLNSEVTDMINRHYQLYLRENVEKYIDLTNAMAGYIKDSIQGVTDSVSQLFGNLQKNLLAVLSFIFTVALANAVSEQPLDNFFTEDIKWILYAVFVGSFVYYGMSIAEVNYVEKRMQKQYDEIIAHYSDILSKEEIKNLTQAKNDHTKEKTLLQEARDELKKGRRFWSVVWIGMIIVAFLIVDFIGSTPHLVKAFLELLKNLLANA